MPATLPQIDTRAGEPAVEDWRAIDLGALAGHTWIAGEPRGSGRGADVMGHPLAALAWLANRLGEFDIALREGDIVLTGSVVATQYPDGPAEAVTEIEGLGRVICAFV